MEVRYVDDPAVDSRIVTEIEVMVLPDPKNPERLLHELPENMYEITVEVARALKPVFEKYVDRDAGEKVQVTVKSPLFKRLMVIKEN
nr:hypothetical protein [Micromonospora sp. DSM 115978]